MKTIGVFKYQGAKDLFINAFGKLGLSYKYITHPKDFDDLDGLVMHGGESSVQYMTLLKDALYEPIKSFATTGKPILGVCAGCILLSGYNSEAVKGLALIDVDVKRNFYGRQVKSTVCKSDTGRDVMFIRAPSISQHGDGVKVLDTFQGVPILAKQGNIHVAIYHPEIMLNGNADILEIFM